MAQIQDMRSMADVIIVTRHQKKNMTQLDTGHWTVELKVEIELELFLASQSNSDMSPMSQSPIINPFSDDP